jgi:hypothetical protein
MNMLYCVLRDKDATACARALHRASLFILIMLTVVALICGASLLGCKHCGDAVKDRISLYSSGGRLNPADGAYEAISSVAPAVDARADIDDLASMRNLESNCKTAHGHGVQFHKSLPISIPSGRDRR